LAFRRSRTVFAAFVLIASVPVAPAAPVYASASVAAAPQSPAFAPSWSKTALDRDAPDPDVVRFGSAYYAYTTGTTWGNHIGVLRSSAPNRGFRTVTGLPYGSSAFPSVPAGQTLRPWQVNSTQHAPGVFEIGGRYVMFYAAQTVAGHGGHYCLSVATAASPAGPFADSSGGPWLCMDAQGGAIDPSPFIDRAGRAWLYFKTYDDINQTSQPAQIYAVRLTANGLGRIGGPVPVLGQSAMSSPYETVENPEMFVSGGAYFLLYSRGQWSSSGYRQGYATCAGPAGPCHEGQPDAILTSYGGVLGPGGGSTFTDPGGRRYLAYQGWNGAPGCTSYQGTSCARELFVAQLRVGSARPASRCHAAQPIRGYRLVASDGGIFSFGNQQFCGSTGAIRLNRPIVGMARTADGGGYWLLASDGGMFNFGDAKFYGSAGASHHPQPFVDMTATPTGHGYWLAASDGSVFAFGDAKFYGSPASRHLAQPVAAMARTRTGHGYWLVTRAGQILPFGDARLYGSAGALNQPILDMEPTRSGNGYWLLGSDGGIFTFGDAHFYGSTGGIHLNQPIVGMQATADAKGYWLVARDGGIFTFGDARFYGSTGGIHLNQPIVGLA
jgi:hypothetical protein